MLSLIILFGIQSAPLKGKVAVVDGFSRNCECAANIAFGMYLLADAVLHLGLYAEVVHDKVLVRLSLIFVFLDGADRKNRVTKAGYDYNAIQKRVNEILS